VRMIVATDSSAILGLGDQGYGGLAISIGKLALYTAGGVSPYHTMPAKLDVGTDRIDLINDPAYLGVRQRRIRGDAYLEFIDKFVSAVKQRWPKAVLQWEDFAKDAAFALLERYRDQLPSFNDDIQGTGAMALAGVLTACQLKHEAITDQRIVILGAGAAGIGVAMVMLQGMVQQGLTREQAHSQIFVLDSKGLLVDGRDALEPYKKQFAQDPQRIADWQLGGDVPTMLEVIQNTKATVLLGLSGQSGAFTEPIIKAMCANNERPIIFPLSNPTSVSEALPEEVILWTDGQAFIATGSPFPDVQYKDRIFSIGQGNNAFIFPGLGFATILAECTQITDAMILEAAMALSDYTIKNHITMERVYPPVREIQKVAICIVKRVIQCALEEGVAQNTKLGERDLDKYLRSKFWRPKYLPVIKGDSIS